MRNWKLRRRAPAEGQHISVTDARSAITGTGTIWILIISTSLAVVVLLGLWAMNSRDLLALDPGGNPAKTAAPTVASREQHRADSREGVPAISVAGKTP